MTLCIGAMALAGEVNAQYCIVLCFDSMLASAEYGAENEYKFSKLSNRAVSIYSGSPARAKELSWIYQSQLEKRPLSSIPEEAIEQLRGPWVELKRRLAESHTQRHLAVSYKDFRNNGEKWFGHDRWQRHMEAIDEHDFNLQMIVAALVGNKLVLYKIDCGEVEANANFCLIGSGAATAEPAMYAREHTFNTTLPYALYNVYEAKKIGEASPFVGQKTTMFVVYRPESESKALRIELVSTVGEKFLAKQFRRYGPKKVRSLLDLPEGSLQATIDTSSRL